MGLGFSLVKDIVFAIVKDVAFAHFPDTEVPHEIEYSVTICY